MQKNRTVTLSDLYPVWLYSKRMCIGKFRDAVTIVYSHVHEAASFVMTFVQKCTRLNRAKVQPVQRWTPLLHARHATQQMFPIIK